MILSWVVASLHLLALPMGLGAVIIRGVALRGPLDGVGVRRVLRADTLWGIAALLWILTGVARAFLGLEKGTAYYLGSTAFWYKMALLAVILVTEIPPMVTFIGWRVRLAKGGNVDTGRARLYGAVSLFQASVVVSMVFAATAMARGMFF